MMEKKDMMMLSAWQSHTGVNISAAILSRLQEWEIEEKVSCILRDNPSNMVSALNIANITSLPALHIYLVLFDFFLAIQCQLHC